MLVLTGEYGAMPHAARHWSEAGGLLCEVLAAELAHCRQGDAPRTGVPPPHSFERPAQSSALNQPQPSRPRPAEAAGNGAHGSGKAAGRQGLQSFDEQAGSGKRDRCPDRNPSGSDAQQVGHENCARPSKQRNTAGDASAVEEGSTGMSQWPCLLEAAAAQVVSLGSQAARKAIPDPPAGFEAGICAAWAALSSPCPLDSTLQGRPRQAAALDTPEGPRHSPTGEGTKQSGQGREGASSGSKRQGPSGPTANIELPEAAAEQDSAPCAAAPASEAGSGSADDSMRSRGVQQPSANVEKDAQENGSMPGTQGEPCGGAGDGGECNTSRRPWLGAPPDFEVLVGPAGFLSCSQQPPRNKALREALQKELESSGDGLPVSYW